MKIVAMVCLVVAVIHAFLFAAEWCEWERGNQFIDGVDVAISAFLVVVWSGAAVAFFLAGGQQ